MQRTKQYKKAYKPKKALTYQQQKQVQAIINKQRELKYYFYTGTTLNVSAVGTITGLPFDVPQGDTDNSRDGDQYTLTGKIQFRFQLLCVDTSNIVRILFFQWHSMSTASPTPSMIDVLLNGPSGSPDVWSAYNHDTRQQYTILSDKMYSLVGNASSANFPNTTSSQVVRTQWIDLKYAKKQVQLRSGGGQGTNRIFMIYISDSTAINHPTLTYMTKTTFYDS